MKLDNKTILVTGANRGIGEAIVRNLLKHNVTKIYAAARNPKSLPDFGDKRITPLALDITNHAQVAAAAAAAKDTQVLINNAGIASFGNLIDGDAKLVANDMTVNYFGTVDMMRTFAPVLHKNRPGVIANIISIVGLAPMTIIGGYSASKSALHSATQAARGELAEKGIHVAGIYPGPIDTDMARNFEAVKASPDDTAKAIIAGIIEGRDYIYPDPMARQVGELWQRDPIALEKQFIPPATKAA